MLIFVFIKEIYFYIITILKSMHDYNFEKIVLVLLFFHETQYLIFNLIKNQKKNVDV